MMLFPLLPILTLYGVTQAVTEVQYYISDTTTSFTAGVPPSCILAVPPIQYREDGTFIAINESQIDDPRGVLKQGRALRIGYVEEYAAFLYKGCVLPRDLTSITHTNIQKEPGLCYSKCRTNFIGLQETTCHCIEMLHNSINIFRNGCVSRCKITSGIVCGSMSEISIYQKVNDNHYTKPRNQGEDCLAYEPATRVRVWASCSKHYQEMCQRKRQIDIREAYPIWSITMQNCLVNSKIPVSNFLQRTIPKKGSELWTGLIRSPTISCRRDDANKKEIYQRGFVKFSNNEFQLVFNQPHTTYTLCENDETTLPMTDTVMTNPHRPVSHTYQPNGISQYASTSATNTVWSNVGSTTKFKAVFTGVTSEIAKANVDSMVAKKGSSKVVLYTVIPVTLVVIGAIMVFIIWKKRYIPICKGTGEGGEEKTTPTAEIKLENSPESLQESQHYNYTLEPMCLYEPMQDRDENETADYDTATPGGLQQNENSLESSNVYNKLDIMPTYSHIGGTVSMHSDDTYNHIDSKSGENMYDSTTSVPSSDKVNKYSDDTYSKVNK